MSEVPTMRLPAILGATFSVVLRGFGGILAELFTPSGAAISMWRLWAIIIYAMVLAMTRRRLS